jgi:hypothetical protein
MTKPAADDRRSSAGAPPPATTLGSSVGAGRLLRSLALALFIPRAISVLTEANFEERQEHSSAQPSRHENDREDLPSHSSHEHRAHAPRHRQRESRPKRQHAGPRCHCSKVSRAESWTLLHHAKMARGEAS